MSAQIEMPRYKCRKEVWALKIAKVEELVTGSGIITPADAGYAPLRVDSNYLRRYNPQGGGYYVVHADGYKGYSPSEVFPEEYVQAKALTDSDLRQAIARAWCDPRNSQKEVDASIVEAAVAEVRALLEGQNR